VVERLDGRRDVIAIDLPGFGDSPVSPATPTPMGWAPEIACFLDDLGLGRVPVVGNSMGGWTALELAKAGHASSVLALAPAGLWHRSPREADIRLKMARFAARFSGPLGPAVLRTSWGRRLALRDQSGRPEAIRPEWAIAGGEDAARAPGWPAHFRAIRGQRFAGGSRIDVPITVVFGDRERILPPKAQLRDELPDHTQWEVWPGCGHVVPWDAPDRIAELVAQLP
jgi:pimeloyl-ACP methyl ester carboxylesterase